MNQIYHKETPTEKEAYTMLIELLRSEDIERTYHVVRRMLLRSQKFQFNQILISKVKLNHGNRNLKPKKNGK